MDLDEIEANSEVSLDTLPTECLIKIFNFLTVEEKLTLAAVAPRFLEIISDPYFAKEWKLVIEGYIHPDIEPCKTFLNNLNQRSFFHVEVGEVEYVEEVYLQMFSNIGRFTKHLKLASRGHKKLLSCFPQLETLEVEGIHDLHCYDPIPSGIKKLHLKYAWQEKKLEGMKNLQEVTSEVVFNDQVWGLNYSAGCDGNLFTVSKELSKLIKDRVRSFSTQKSLFKAHIDFSDITALSCSSFDPFYGDLIKALNLFQNLEHLDYEPLANVHMCFGLHGMILNLPKLKSLNLSVWDDYIDYFDDSFCDECFESIMNSSSNLISLTKISLPALDDYYQVKPFFQRFPLITDLTLNKASNVVLKSLNHIKNLKRFKFGTLKEFNLILLMLKHFSSLEYLEELNLKDLLLVYEEYEYSECDYDCDGCEECETCNRYGRSYEGSLFSEFTLKCPNVKKFKCVVKDSDNTDVLAMINGWPKLNFLEIVLGPGSTPIDFEKAFRCLQEQKEQGWKPPPLKHFAYIESNPTKVYDLPKLFDIFPTLRTVQITAKYGRTTITLADHQKKLLENQ